LVVKRALHDLTTAILVTRNRRPGINSTLSNLAPKSKLNKFHLRAPSLALTGRTAALIVFGMSRKIKYILLCFALLNFTIAGVSESAAYLDPGTGSIIFQSIVAVAATGLAVLATAWKNVTGFFGGFFGRLFNSNIEKHSDKE
jgi:hypothetical protein